MIFQRFALSPEHSRMFASISATDVEVDVSLPLQACLSAQKRWRRLRGFDRLAYVITGVQFVNGEQASTMETDRSLPRSRSYTRFDHSSLASARAGDGRAVLKAYAWHLGVDQTSQSFMLSSRGRL